MESFAKLIRADLCRMGSPTLGQLLRAYFIPRGGTFPYVFWLRVEHCLRRGGWFRRFWGAVFYPVFRHYEFKYGVHANPNIEIGGGLCVVHGDGVYLNCERIGKNLTVYQGVTLGVLGGKRPCIEDGVTIYPNAIIVGGVNLGMNCTIGALSYVSHDVPCGVTVIGAPAKKVGPL